VSIEAMTHVWKHSKQKGTALLVMLAIADHTNDEHGVAWPSVRKLAERARTTRTHVQRLLRRLEEAGELQVLLRHGTVSTTGGSQKTNIYRVVVVESEGGHKMLPPSKKHRKGGHAQAAKGATPMWPYPLLEPSKELSTKAFHKVERRKREDPEIDISEAGMKKVMDDLRRFGMPT